MEYMDCGSLADVLRHVKKVPEAYVAEIARQVRLPALHHIAETALELCGWRRGVSVQTREGRKGV